MAYTRPTLRSKKTKTAGSMCGQGYVIDDKECTYGCGYQDSKDVSYEAVS
jgi:hypothetical protein